MLLVMLLILLLLAKRQCLCATERELRCSPGPVREALSARPGRSVHPCDLLLAVAAAATFITTTTFVFAGAALRATLGTTAAGLATTGFVRLRRATHLVRDVLQRHRPGPGTSRGVHGLDHVPNF